MRDQPIAYFLTFRTYGTWLHGDERGSVSKRQNGFREPRHNPDPGVEHLTKERSGPPIVLNTVQRNCVAAAITEVAAVRQWALLAVNVRTNHVHLVISGPETPQATLVTLKAWATRHLKQERLIGPTAKVWARYGSTRHVWTSASLERVCHYVTELQDKGDEWEPSP